jgi:hypothetical protein
MARDPAEKRWYVGIGEFPKDERISKPQPSKRNVSNYPIELRRKRQVHG